MAERPGLPPTPKQLEYLQGLARELGYQTPRIASKDEASEAIGKFKWLEPASDEQIDLLRACHRSKTFWVNDPLRFQLCYRDAHWLAQQLQYTAGPFDLPRFVALVRRLRKHGYDLKPRSLALTDQQMGILEGGMRTHGKLANEKLQRVWDFWVRPEPFFRMLVPLKPTAK